MFWLSNKTIISKAIVGVKIALMEHFGPKFLGFSDMKKRLICICNKYIIYIVKLQQNRADCFLLL